MTTTAPIPDDQDMKQIKAQSESGDSFAADKMDFDQSKQFSAHSQSGDSYAAERMTIYQATIRDLLASGRKALDQRLYPEALQRFTEFLSTVQQGPALPDAEVAPQVAEANLCAAVALLGGANIGNKSPQVITQVDNHLERARGAGSRADTFNLASVLWAIVKEDSEADGMFTRPPRAEELRQSLDQLSTNELIFLSSHIRQARGQTFIALQQKSGTEAVSTVPPPMAHHVPPGRPKAVSNYFRKPIGATEIMWMIFGGVGLIMLLGGLASGDASTFACLFIPAIVILAVAFSKTIGCLLAYPKPGNNQMDEWLYGDIEQTVRPRALAQLRIDPRPTHEGGDLVVPPQIVVGVAMPGTVWQVTRTLAFWGLVFGSDGRIRSTHYRVLILFMSDKIVSAYTALLDTRTGNLLMDATQEHRYADIAGVESTTIPINVSPEMRKQISQDTLARVSAEHTFSLNIVDGKSLSVTVDLPTAASGSGGGVAWGNAQSLAMIQRMVRGKKEG